MNTDQIRQKLEESPVERKSRKDEGFDDLEPELPRNVGNRGDIPVVDNLSSYLGTYNPAAKDIDPPSDVVWLFDNTAYRPVHVYPHSPQPWQAEFVAAYFKRNSGKDISAWVADIADKVGFAKGTTDREDAEKTIAERLQPFVDTIQPARFVNVVFPPDSEIKLGPGGRNAVSVDTIVVPGEHKDGDSHELKAVHEEVTPHGPMLTHYAGPEGWTVISDIDDSIKITMTSDPIGILRSTFINKPTPIAGMPELYQHIDQLLKPSWFYLSASPYNLYTFLRPFLHQYYPKGQVILREASWMDLGGFLASLTQGTEAYKSSRMDKVHEWLPKRKILCVGDSTQSDPEAYGDIYRKHAGWIKAIFIRKVTDVSGMEDSDKNKDERFEKAFKDVPRDVWRVFEDPQELYQAVGDLTDSTV